jgi:hypothetical protein
MDVTGAPAEVTARAVVVGDAVTAASAARANDNSEISAALHIR